jgi:ubiquinone/menaquinone biosynthesis C-methylase UbiE
MIDDNILEPGQFYDEMASHYDDFISKTRFNFLPSEEEKNFLNILLSDRRSILDIGCGTGRTIALLNSEERNLLGIDIAPNMLRIAKNNGAKTILASAYALPFEDNSFDAIISVHMGYGFCENRMQMETLTNEIYRVLKSDGLALLDTPHSGTKGDRYITEWAAGDKIIKAVSYGKNKDQIMNLLAETGFRQSEFYGFYNSEAYFKEDSRRIIAVAIK